MPSPDPPLPKRQRAPGDAPNESVKSEVPSPANDAGEMPLGGKQCRPNFESWATLAHWEPHEAACLSCDIDPRSLPDKHQPSELPLDELSDRIWFRAEAIRRAIDIGRLDKFIAPLDALNVFDDIGADYPKELRDIAEAARPNRSLATKGQRKRGRGNQWPTTGGVTDSATGDFPETTPSQTKVIATLYKIILAYAVHSHRFVPERPNNPTAGRLHRIVTEYFKMDVDTIRAHLRIAADTHWHERIK